MYKDLYDFLEINGLQSITILFNVVTRYHNGAWKPVDKGEGFKLLHQLRDHKNFRINEANSTRWGSHSENLMETYYAASFEVDNSKDPLTVKQVLGDVIRIVDSYQEPQVYINNFYQLNAETTSLQRYMHGLDRAN